MKMEYKEFIIEPSYYSGYDFVHPDYDGAPEYAYSTPTDPRCGHGETIESCKAQIDEIIEELKQN